MIVHILRTLNYKQIILHSVPSRDKVKTNKIIQNWTYDVEKVTPSPSKSTSTREVSSSPPLEDSADSQPELPSELLSGPGCEKSEPAGDMSSGDT